MVLGLAAWRLVVWENRRHCERNLNEGDERYVAAQAVSLLWQSCDRVCVVRREVCRSSMERKARSNWTEGGNMTSERKDSIPRQLFFR